MMKSPSIKFKHLLSRMITPKGKSSFLASIPPKGKILDVGCGNESPLIAKTIRRDIHYVGLDIETYNLSSESIEAADSFFLTNQKNFHEKIHELPNDFDAIICSHNLEHCNDYMAVTKAMAKSLKKEGTLYISFPCEESVNFPNRDGSLNFYDDLTHKNVISYTPYIDGLKKMGLKIVFSKKRYRPIFPFLIGLIFEPFGRVMNRQAPLGGTWALYGFETIIIAKKT